MKDKIETLKKMFPDLTDKPQVSIPFICKIWHKMKMYGTGMSRPKGVVQICARCGLVEEGWVVFSMMNYSEHFHKAGYINPQKFDFSKEYLL